MPKNKRGKVDIFFRKYPYIDFIGDKDLMKFKYVIQWVETKGKVTKKDIKEAIREWESIYAKESKKKD
jgi:hypothetical protein